METGSKPPRRTNRWAHLIGAAMFVLLAASPCLAEGCGDRLPTAYIGPGAGLALMGSFLAVLMALFSAIGVLLTWPIRWLWRAARGRRARQCAKTDRVVVLGLDGLDPDLTERFMEEGLLPNLAMLREEGTYARLGTTWPPLSPVAWSTFSTGTNPGKHNIFDFLRRNPTNYRPAPSSVRMHEPQKKLPVGPYRYPLRRTRIEGLRKSRPFWAVLGEAGVFSEILRVPVTFPPERFHGLQLSAMSTPDLRGTQGTFCYFHEDDETDATNESGEEVGGEYVRIERDGKYVEAYLPGPENPYRPDSPTAKLPLKVSRDRTGNVILQVGGTKVRLEENQYTDWVRLTFRLAPGVKIRGVCKFLLKRFEPPFQMYCTPLHIDPHIPAMPISHPPVFATYLANQLGTFATAGLAEDTSALSEGVISEEAFLKQTYDIDNQRQAMFFDALRRVRRGLVVCVFDAPDRIQHMFWRFSDEKHPAQRDTEAQKDDRKDVIREMYARMDKLVGRTIEKTGKNSALLVMSDHGFKTFRHGVDLNAWLLAEGYLKLKDEKRSSDRSYLADIDWDQTKAYAIGLSGIYINQKGREGRGIVAKGGETEQLVRELCEKLTGLFDTRGGDVAVREAVAREHVYSGPYVEAAPDVILGYNKGYRVSWDSAVGKCGPDVFVENAKAWSGDHCIHPSLVPGVLLSTLKLQADEANIVDLAPTVLDLLGVEKPTYMDGRPLTCDDASS